MPDIAAAVSRQDLSLNRREPISAALHSERRITINDAIWQQNAVGKRLLYPGARRRQHDLKASQTLAENNWNEQNEPENQAPHT